jgi:hypothetical protein
VPLSTSSSSSADRIPPAPYVLLWVLASALFVASASLSEVLWRSKGFRPSVPDTVDFWSLRRCHVYTRRGRRRMVVLGSSRAQLGISPAALRESFPEYGDAIHLAIDGTSPRAVLHDLCEDPEFDGTIICGATASFLLSGHDGRGDEYVSHYRRAFSSAGGLEKGMNVWIGGQLQARLAVLSSSLRLQRLVLLGPPAQDSYVHMDWDRYRPAHYLQRMTVDRLRKHRGRRVATAQRSQHLPLDEFQSDVSGGLRRDYEVLRSRGGKLVFIRMPTTDEHWEIDEATAPKAGYWDRITELSGIPTVHFMDYPQLRSYECPDTSHLDATDAHEFTRHLAMIVKAKLEETE